MCFILSLTGYIYVYLNGELFNRYTSYFLRGQSFPQNTRSALVLGQETNDLNVARGIRRRAKSFVGSISHFTLYGRPISLDEVKSAYDKVPSDKGVLIGWDQFIGKAPGGKIVEEFYKTYPF